MFFEKIIIAIKCDRCEEEINPMFPQRHFDDEHYCWDCSFINGYISEHEYLTYRGGISPNDFRATIRDGEIIVWSGNIPPWEKKPSEERRTKAYREWRKAVLDRDDNKCTKCGLEEELHAHHKKEFAKHPELRFVVKNGLTLCKSCHKEIHRKK